MDCSKPWREYTYVAFDLETSGAYPLGADIVEFGAVKWQNGKEIDEMQFLIKPREAMTEFIIKIHGITNEMVALAPPIEDKIDDIRNFFSDSVLMAHHAPFDMGFVAVDFEKNAISLPKNPVICTSLLARKVITESSNHKLQTLIKVLNLNGGTAHRGLDDARACLQLGLICMERVGKEASLQSVYDKVGKNLMWSDFTIQSNFNSQPIFKIITEAIEHKSGLDIVYQGGSLKGTRRINPLGIVRNPDGDYVQAICQIDRISKRFYLNKITDIQLALF